MEKRQKIFIESVLSRKTPENRELIETVLKAYVLNEGILDKTKELAGKAKEVAGKVAGKVPGPKETPKETPKEAPKPAVPGQTKSNIDYATLRRTMIFEQDCWERDLSRFYANCEMVKYYLLSYGIRDFNEIVRSDDFKKAIEMGRTLDRMRENPLLREDSRRQVFGECLEKLNWGDNRPLVEGIIIDFAESERPQFDIHPMFESKKDVYLQFKECMAGIANFIRRHGFYPWARFLQENRFLLSRANSFDKEEPTEVKEPVNPRLAAEIRKSYSAGSAEANI